jgi:hypothetical protein
LNAFLIQPCCAEESEGALPKGRSDSVPGEKVQVTKVDEGGNSCSKYWASIPDAKASYTADGGTLFLLAQVGARSPKQSPNIEALDRYTVFKFDVVERGIRSLLSLSLKLESAIVSHGNPVTGLSIASFKKDGACATGSASVVTFPINLQTEEKPKVAKSFPPGEYAAVGTSGGRLLADLTAGQFPELDLKTFQRRKGPTFNNKETPIFFDLVRKHIYTWNPKESGSVFRYTIGKSTPVAQLKLSPGYKLINDGPKFGVISVDLDSNELTVHELAKWTGDSTKQYRIKVPKEESIEQAMLAIDFNAKMLVMGTRIPPDQSVRRLRLYQYTTATLSSDLKAEAGKAFGHVSFAPGRPLVIASLHKEGGALDSLTMYEIDGRKWINIALQQER